MLLRDMKPGEKGVIKSFRPGLIEYRKRLLALGALPGTPFVVERVAPLGDPVEIKLRGSSISVRKGEIEIGCRTDQINQTMRKNIIAVVGNPNCGKTTLFNGLTGSHQTVGNWPGVTVERIVGEFTYKDREITIVDLPGIYSLQPSSASSEDERVARDYILQDEAELIVNIVDASNLERNLYLTTQLLDDRGAQYAGYGCCTPDRNRSAQTQRSLGLPCDRHCRCERAGLKGTVRRDGRPAR